MVVFYMDALAAHSARVERDAARERADRLATCNILSDGDEMRVSCHARDTAVKGTSSF